MTCECVEAETYRQMHETARELGYPSILEALEALERLSQSSDGVTVTEEMIEAGVQAFNKNETLSVRRLLRAAFPAMFAAMRSAATSSDRSE